MQSCNGFSIRQIRSVLAAKPFLSYQLVLHFSQVVDLIIGLLVLCREPVTALVQETISGVNSIVLSPNDTIRTSLGRMLVGSANRGQDEM